jgi:cell division septal protein FtsQ
MGRGKRVIGGWVRFGAALTATVALAGGISRIPEALTRVETFKVQDMELVGAHYLTLEEAALAMAVPGGASVWDDMEAWEFGLRQHPMVRDASVRRQLPGTLVMEVAERTPVALIPTPVLEPVDATGRILPLDPASYRLDLPVLQPFQNGVREASPLTPVQVRILAQEVARLKEEDPRFMGLVSEVGLDSRGGITATLIDPPVEMVFRPPLSGRRIQEGLHALADAMEREPERIVEAVDLRYADQVVVRFSTSRRR